MAMEKALAEHILPGYAIRKFHLLGQTPSSLGETFPKVLAGPLGQNEGEGLSYERKTIAASFHSPICP